VWCGMFFIECITGTVLYVLYCTCCTVRTKGRGEQERRGVGRGGTRRMSMVAQGETSGMLIRGGEDRNSVTCRVVRFSAVQCSAVHCILFSTVLWS
jgi:hypothetical protein